MDLHNGIHRAHCGAISHSISLYRYNADPVFCLAPHIPAARQKKGHGKTAAHQVSRRSAICFPLFTSGTCSPDASVGEPTLRRLAVYFLQV